MANSIKKQIMARLVNYLSSLSQFRSVTREVSVTKSSEALPCLMIYDGQEAEVSPEVTGFRTYVFSVAIKILFENARDNWGLKDDYVYAVQRVMEVDRQLSGLCINVEGFGESPFMVSSDSTTGGAIVTFDIKYRRGITAPLVSFADLVSYWKMDEASGIRYDSVGTNHLSETNTVPQAVGKIRSAASLTKAAANYLSVASNSSLQLGNSRWTYYGWFKPKGTTQGENCVFCKGYTGSPGGEYLLRQLVSGGIRLDVRSADGLSTAQVSNATATPLNTWHFFAVWYDGSALYARVNDATTSTPWSGGVQAGNNPLVFGYYTGFYSDSDLDEWAFFRRVLSTAELDNAYNGGNALPQPFQG